MGYQIRQWLAVVPISLFPPAYVAAAQAIWFLRFSQP